MRGVVLWWDIYLFLYIGGVGGCFLVDKEERMDAYELTIKGWIHMDWHWGGGCVWIDIGGWMHMY